ncbi:MULTISPECIES: serine hydrolase domain-containing protein [Streptomyces]|uniref:serine hydrolase domain-containing protein n=1 Tax=Streptomyces TaxID=1883 RepID=UPI001E2CA666|nr:MULTISPECIES: serine hydrolase domain-containing protein [Streptomyces]UFQ19874.1 beta-lactamase family protein [Streptomyces huasconensis]WCL89497.1 serine hydrolase [Streptomyces sp. JCM 35825]
MEARITEVGPRAWGSLVSEGAHERACAVLCVNARPGFGKAVLAAGVAMLMMVHTGPATATANAAPTRSGGNVQKATEELARIPGVVGVVGGAYVDGKSLGLGSAGSRLLGGEGGRIPADARFRIWSQTKQMVATVLLKLVEEGELGVDDKLGELLPEVVEKDLVTRADQITVRQMIRHTSGIPDWYAEKPNPDGSEGEPSFDVFDFTTPYRPLDLVRWSRDRPRTGEPGEKWAYSNTNYTLLGMIIERVTGHDLASELRTRLFEPLGMTRSYLMVKPPDGVKGRHGHGYYPDADGRPRDVDRYNAGLAGAGAGGVVSTAHDVSAFNRALSQGKLLPPELQRILTDRPTAAAHLRGNSNSNSNSSCSDDFSITGGLAPGSVAMTFYSADGRRQLALSFTLSVKPGAVQLDIGNAVESIFCPSS